MPTPTIIWKGALTLIAQPESGAASLADRVMLTDIYRGPIDICNASVLRRGTFGTGLRLGWVVTSSKVDPEKKGIGKLTITWELGGAFANPAFLPLDEFDVQPVELNPKVERHPYFYGSGYPGDPNDKISPSTISLCYSAINAPTTEARNTAIQNINNLSDSAQKTWGKTLLDLLLQGNETYYLIGLRYHWTWYSFTTPALNRGGSLSSPLGPMSGRLPGDLNWVRLADTIQSAGVNGSVFKITSSWVGTPAGYWNPVLYP